MSNMLVSKDERGMMTLELPQLTPHEEFIDGRKLITLQDAIEQGKESLTPNDPGLLVGGAKVHSKTNIAIEGQSQFGKTSIVKLHAAQIAKRIKEGSREKIIIYDATGLFLPFLYAIAGDEIPLYLMNPSDERGVAFDIASDISGQGDTFTLAQILVRQEEQDSQPFFQKSGYLLAAGVMDYFYLSSLDEKEQTGEPIDWTLADAARGCASQERIKALMMRQRKYLERRGHNFLNRKNLDIPATISAHGEPLFSVAAMWEDQPKFSIKKFLQSDEPGILVLGRSQQDKVVMQEMNRFIVELAAKILLDSKKEVEYPRYWFILDEFTELGKIEAIPELLKRGLKYGIRTLTTYQDYHEVKKVYGDELAKVIYSQGGTRYFFRLDGDNAQVAADRIGKYTFRRWIESFTTSIQETKSESSTWGTSTSEQEGWSKQGQASGTSGSTTRTTSSSHTSGHSIAIGATRSRQEQIITEHTVKPEVLKELREGEFICLTPKVKGVWKTRYEWEELSRIAELESPDPKHAAYIRRTDPRLGYLKDWAIEDLERLKLLDLQKELLPAEAPAIQEKEQPKITEPRVPERPIVIQFITAPPPPEPIQQRVDVIPSAATKPLKANEPPKQKERTIPPLPEPPKQKEQVITKPEELSQPEPPKKEEDFFAEMRRLYGDESLTPKR